MSEGKAYQKAGILAVLTVLTASFFNTITSIINPAIASLAAAYPNESLSTIQLVSTIPMLAAIPTSFIAGKFINKVGIKQSLIILYAITIISGIIPAFSTTSYMPVLACRVVFGLVSGIVVPLNAMMVTAYIEPSRQPAMFGYKQGVGNVIGIAYASLAGIIAVRNVFNIWWLHLILCVPLFLAFFLPKTSQPELAQGKSEVEKSNSKGRISTGAWVIIVVMGLFSIFSYPAFLYLSSLIEANGMGDASVSGFISTASTIGGIIGSMFFGKFYKAAKNRVIPLFMLLLVVNYLLFAFTSSTAIYFIANLIGGIGYFGMFVALNTGLSKNTSENSFGTAVGVMSVVKSVAMFACPYVMNFVAQIAGQTANFAFLFVVCGVVFAVLTVILFVKPLKM